MKSGGRLLQKPLAIVVAAIALSAVDSRDPVHHDSSSAAWANSGEKPPDVWRDLEPGLALAELVAPQKADVGDSTVRVLRIDPAHFDLELLNASASGQGRSKTAKKWANHNDLVAAINASMFQVDRRTSVALMKTIGHTNNAWISKDKAVLAFDPISDDLPSVQIIDRECQDFESLKGKYRSLVQNIRMVSCHGQNVWAQQPKKWSTAAVGMDRKRRVLFLHARSPYSTHDFISILLDLPIDLKSAMYVEGGPEAQLYVKSGGSEFEWVGSFETGFNENDSVTVAWPIPNVIGVARKSPKSGEHAQ